MVFGVSEIIAFIIGGIVFRYFEEIRDFVFKLREAFQRIRDESRN
jgi:hypothetical protein